MTVKELIEALTQLPGPSLDAKVRRKVWDIMLKRAEIKVQYEDRSIANVYDLELNGRQIRNTVRLAKVLYGNEFTSQQLETACAFVCK